MDYVNEESNTLARKWEELFAAVPAKAGIVFVGVKPNPTPDGNCRQYLITLGLDRSLPFDESTGRGIVLKVLKDELDSGEYTILVNSFRGVAGAGALSA